MTSKKIRGALHICNLYYYGDGVDVDKNQAFLLCKRAAEAGNIGDMRNLSKCYRKGVGITQNIDQAEYLERKSIYQAMGAQK